MLQYYNIVYGFQRVHKPHVIWSTRFKIRIIKFKLGN